MSILKLQHIFDGQHRLVVKLFGITIAKLDMMKPTVNCQCQGEVMDIKTPQARDKDWPSRNAFGFSVQSPEPKPEDFVS